VREYLYIEQLAALTPGTPQAIRTLVSRGKLKQGVHFFRPLGPTSRPIFRWSAVRDFIEGANSCATTEGTILLANGAVVDVDGDGEAEDTSRVHG
jgi:hypothetical protein